MRFFLKLALGAVFAVLFGCTAFAQTMQGRLTLASNTPVMTGDVTNATSVYYTPYVGNIIQSSNGTTIGDAFFTQMTLSLNSSVQASGDIYDLFTINSGGTWYLCTGPAWSSSILRSTGISQLQGIWVNTTAISNCNYSSSSIAIPAKEGVYVGSVYMTGNGETSMQLKPSPANGGSGNVIGLFNAYNRVRATALDQDNNSSWTQTSANTWTAADSSTNNRITWLDGLQQVNIKARYEDLFAVSTNQSAALVGIDLDSDTATPDIQGGSTVPTAANFNADAIVEESWYPQIGLHYVQAMQNLYDASSTTMTFYGTPYHALSLDTEY